MSGRTATGFAVRPVSQFGGNGKKIKILLDFFLWGNLPPVCLRVSPGLLRHSCGPASCHTSSMAAKLRLALTQNSSPTPLANRRRVAQIAVSKGRVFGRPPQRTKYPRRARRETPARRNGRPPSVPKRHPQMSQSPAKGHGPHRHPLWGWTAGTICQPMSTNAPPTMDVGRDLCVPPLVCTIDQQQRRGRHP